MTVQDLYKSTVQPLPPKDRLRLASLILDELTASNDEAGGLDISDSWTDEDATDLAAFSMKHALMSNSEDAPHA